MLRLHAPIYTELGVATSVRLGLLSTILIGVPAEKAAKFLPPPLTWQVAGGNEKPPDDEPLTWNSPYCAAIIWPAFCPWTAVKQGTVASTNNKSFFIILIELSNPYGRRVGARRLQIDQQR